MLTARSAQSASSIVHMGQGRPQDFFQGGPYIGGGKGQRLGDHHGECGARACNGGSGSRAPSGVQRQNPGWSGGQAEVRSPLSEAESILVIGCPTEPANLAPSQKCICISTLGATVMIWENLCRSPGGSGDPVYPFLGAPMSAHYCQWVSIQCYNLKITLANILLNKLNLLCCSIVVKKLAQTIGVRY